MFKNLTSCESASYTLDMMNIELSDDEMLMISVALNFFQAASTPKLLDALGDKRKVLNELVEKFMQLTGVKPLDND